jgi:hypothetical protein
MTNLHIPREKVGSAAECDEQVIRVFEDRENLPADVLLRAHGVATFRTPEKQLN